MRNNMGTRRSGFTGMFVTALAVLVTLVVSAAHGTAGDADGSSAAAAAAPLDFNGPIDNVQSLPVGKQTTMPYADNRTRTIYDGARRVSYSGMVGEAYQLYKVDGGYVVARLSSDRRNCQLVFISTSGRRVQWDSGFECVRGYPYPIDLVVSSNGDRIVYDVPRAGVDTTVVRDVSTGSIVRQRAFPASRPLADLGRVFISSLNNGLALWWDPVTNTTETYAPGLYATAVDASADQVFANRSMHPFAPPGPATWTFTEEIPINGGSWSTDDRHFDLVYEPDDQVTRVPIHDALTGSFVGGVDFPYSMGGLQTHWETPDTFLVDLTAPGQIQKEGRIVRCRFSTNSCGQLPGSARFVIATRRPS